MTFLISSGIRVTFLNRFQASQLQCNMHRAPRTTVHPQSSIIRLSTCACLCVRAITPRACMKTVRLCVCEVGRLG